MVDGILYKQIYNRVDNMNNNVVNTMGRNDSDYNMKGNRTMLPNPTMGIRHTYSRSTMARSSHNYRYSSRRYYNRH